MAELRGRGGVQMAPRAARWLAFALVFAFPASVKAQSVQATVAEASATDARAAFEEGVAAFAAGEFHRASERFEFSYRTAQRVPTLYNLARAYESEGRIRLAIERLVQFVGLTHDSAAVAEANERIARLRLLPTPVTVVTVPPGGSVHIEGHPEASTPGSPTFSLRPGEYFLVTEHPGYRRDTRRLVVEPEDRLMPSVETVVLEALVTAPPPAETVYDRILARRARTVNYRLAVLGGVAWPGTQYEPALGVEATAFWRRSLAVQIHFLQIETSGNPMMLTGELGWVFVVEDLDIGVFAHAGAVLNCSQACPPPASALTSYVVPNVQFTAGLTLRADVVILPRVGIGLFGRFSWRNLDVGDSASLLSSLGLSISFLL